MVPAVVVPGDVVPSLTVQSMVPLENVPDGALTVQWCPVRPVQWCPVRMCPVRYVGGAW